MNIKQLHQSSIAITEEISNRDTQPIKHLGSKPFDLRNTLQANSLFAEKVSIKLAENSRCLPYLTSSAKENATLLAATKLLVESNPIKTYYTQITEPRSMGFAYNPQSSKRIEKLFNIENACLNAVPSCKTKSFFKTFQLDLRKAQQATTENRTIIIILKTKALKR